MIIMKNLTSVKKNVLILVTFLIGVATLPSCLKDTGNNTQSPVAGLMAFNLSTSAPAIGFTLSGNNLTNTPLAYTNYTGGYLGIYAGTRPVIAFDASGGNILASSDYTFEQEKYYSLFLVGDTSYQNIVVKDKIDTLAGKPGKAYIRYINAIAGLGSPVVKISQNGNDVINGNANFGNVSDFAVVQAGQITIKVNSNDTLQVERTITVDERKVYTALLTGKPGVSDSVKAVSIKYITNGTLSPDSTTNGLGRVNDRTIGIQ
ncbi:MAG: DUF4397 domain-containing protein [Bacteroidetes bacterium]|nr:DUF4397 domain-containing protein [Bacteroidota bacterium]